MELTTLVSEEIPPSTIVAKSGCEMRSFTVVLKHLLHTLALFFCPNCSGRLARRPQQSPQNSPPHLRQWCLQIYCITIATHNLITLIDKNISPAIQESEGALTSSTVIRGLVRDPCHSTLSVCHFKGLSSCYLLLCYLCALFDGRKGP